MEIKEENQQHSGSGLESSACCAGWVTDRLPPLHECEPDEDPFWASDPVLVTVEGAKFSASIQIGEYSTCDGWVITTDSGWLVAKNEEVKAWMRLPDPFGHNTEL